MTYSEFERLAKEEKIAVTRDDVAEAFAEAFADCLNETEMHPLLAIAITSYASLAMKILFEKHTPVAPPCAEEIAQEYKKGE